MPIQYVFSKVNLLRELRQARNVPLLAKEVQKMAKQINQRFYRLEKAGLSHDSYAYEYASNLLGKAKPRYPTSLKKLQNMQRDELYKLALEINEKIASPTSAIRGVKAIQEKRIANSLKVLKEKGYDIKREDFEEFINNGGDELLNYFESYQIIEDFYNNTQSGNVSVKEFIREFKRYKNIKRVDYTRVMRNLNRLSKRKMEREMQRKMQR